MPRKSFYMLLVSELRDLYSAGNLLARALPQLVSQVTAPEVKEAFNQALEETKAQIERLNQILNALQEDSQGATCYAVQGLLAETKKVQEANFPAIVNDAAMIGYLQRIMHNGIASYGVAASFAKNLGFNEHAKLLKQSISEKVNMDKKLTSLAEGGFFDTGINALASEE